MWDIIKFAGAMIFAALALPSKIIFEGMNQRRVTTKGETLAIVFGLWLLTLTIAHFTSLPAVGFVAGYFFWAGIVGLFTVRPDAEFKEIANQVKAERKNARLEKRNGGSTAGTNTVGKYEVIKLLERIESVMVGSGFYKAEDQEKNPGYFLEDFYKVTGLQDNGDCIVTLILPPGKRSADMDKFIELLPAGLDYHSAERFSEQGDTAGIARFRVYATEPENNNYDFMKDNFSALDYIRFDGAIDMRKIPVGMMEDKTGGLIYFDMFQNHYLIGGSTKGGKSVNSAIIACQLARTNAILYGIDLKKVELNTISGRFAGIAKHRESALVLLRALVEEMHRRNTDLLSRGITKLSLDDPDAPPIVLFVDEVAELLGGGNTKEEKAMIAEIDALLRSLAQLARSVSISVILMTQSPKADIINTQLRNNLPNRVGLYTSDRTQLVTILGEEGNNLPLIPLGSYSGWFVGGNYPGPAKFKAFYLTDEERENIIRKHMDKYRELPVEYLGEFTQVAWECFVDDLKLTEDGFTKLVTAKNLPKLVNDLNSTDAAAVYRHVTTSKTFPAVFAKRFGGYSENDAYVEAYEKRYLVNH